MSHTLRATSLAFLLLACTPKPEEATTVRDVVAVAGPDQEVVIGEEIILDGRGSTEGTAVWNMGDGTELTGTLVTHTYTSAGNYVAVLEITGPGGLTRSDSVRITAYRPPAEVPPTHSSSVVFDSDHQQVVVVEPDANVVTALRADGTEVIHTPTCAKPAYVARRDQAIAVSCELAAEVDVFDPQSWERERTFSLGTGMMPAGIVGTTSGWLVAGQSRGLLYRIDDNGAQNSIEGTDVRAIATRGNDDIYMARFRSPSHQGELYRIGHDVISLARDPGPDSDTGHRGVPNLLEAIAISPDGATAYVGGLIANIERGAYRDGAPLTFETTVHATVRIIDLTSDAEDLDARKVIDNQGAISAMALSPLGNWLWVAHPGTGTIHRLDAYTLEIKGAILGAGNHVRGLAISDSGDTLFVHASLDRQVLAYDISDPSRPPTLRWTAPTTDLEPLDAAVLRGKKIFHDARDVRIARDGYLSCATCHPDGREDGQTWDFTDRGEGIRNTITLEGRGGTDMGRLHWSGNFDEVQDFELDIRHGQGGLGLLDEASWLDPSIQDPLGVSKAGLSADLDDLAAYVHSLTSLPASPYPAIADGEALFDRAGCGACHVPSTLYTDSAEPSNPRHDVGTLTEESGQRLGMPLDGLDTPTLLGVWSTPPYLHDGSAINLESAIGAHQDVDLTSAELATLAAYLRTL